MMPSVTPGRRPMPVIVGAPRSGTTLLRFMLDAHPEMAIPPETGFLMLGPSFQQVGHRLRDEVFRAITAFPPDAPAWNDFGLASAQLWARFQAIEPFSVAAGYRAFYQAYAERFDKPRWGDKTPGYWAHLQAIAQILPETHFIHVIRDGRDVALSWRQMWFSPSDDIGALAAHWVTCVTTARQQGQHCDHYIEVRFEDLIEDSRTVLEQLCTFLDLPYSDEMLRYPLRTPDRLAEHRERRTIDGTLQVTHEMRRQQQALTMQAPQASRVQAWRTGMSGEEQADFERVAGGLLRTLGYR